MLLLRFSPNAQNAWQVKRVRRTTQPIAQVMCNKAGAFVTSLRPLARDEVNAMAAFTAVEADRCRRRQEDRLPTVRNLPDKLAYTAAEVAELMGFSRQTATRLFENEPGVLKIENPETVHRRRYRSLRIPRHVYLRVVERISVP